jgi:hypothetical protein
MQSFQDTFYILFLAMAIKKQIVIKSQIVIELFDVNLKPKAASYSVVKY